MIYASVFFNNTGNFLRKGLDFTQKYVMVIVIESICQVSNYQIYFLYISKDKAINVSKMLF